MHMNLVLIEMRYSRATGFQPGLNESCMWQGLIWGWIGQTNWDVSYRYIVCVHGTQKLFLVYHDSAERQDLCIPVVSQWGRSFWYESVMYIDSILWGKHHMFQHQNKNSHILKANLIVIEALWWPGLGHLFYFFIKPAQEGLLEMKGV